MLPLQGPKCAKEVSFTKQGKLYFKYIDKCYNNNKQYNVTFTGSKMY